MNEISKLKIFFLCIGLLFSGFLYPQYNISGKVVDTQDNPIAYANVFLLDTNTGDVINGTISNTEGKFELTTTQKEVILKLTFLGYTSLQKNLLIKQNIQLETVVLQEDNEALESVIIKAATPLIEQKVDRLVFNVSQSIAATGGNAIDALKVTPRIKVQNDEISMMGKGNLRVMINDRIVYFSGEELINYLKSINTEDIQRIEVISNPPAKYSAEGNSGLINIITKKTIDDAWNASLKSTYKQATYAIGSIGGGFNFQKDKFQVTSSVIYANGSSAPIETNQVYYPNLTWKYTSNRRDYQDYLSARMGVDHNINKKISTGFSYKYSSSQPLSIDNNSTKLYSVPFSALDSLIKTPGRKEGKINIHNFNYHIIYEIDTVGRKLSLDFDFFNFYEKSNRKYESKTLFSNNEPTPNSFVKARNFGIQDIQNYSVNIDMEHPTKWASLNYGGKISFIKTDNLFNTYDYLENEEVFNQMLSNQFVYQENTQALYVSLQKEFLKNWEAKAGLRIENTQTEGYSKTLNQTNTNHYTKLFPTAYLAYTLNNDNSFSLNYGRRIKRPRFFFLNPFRWVSSPYSYSEGNPFLQAAFIDNVELGYSYKNKLISSIYYSYTDDNFEQVIFLDEETNTQQIIPKNFIVNKTFGVNQSFNFKPKKWWDLYASADVYYSSTNSKIPSTLHYLSGWNGYFYVSNDLTLNSDKTLFFNISYSYTTKGVDNLDYNTSANELNSSLKWLLLNKKLTLNLYVNDILSSQRYTFQSYNNGIRNAFRNYYDQRYFRFSVAYNFGKDFKSINRESKNKDELNRLN